MDPQVANAAAAAAAAAATAQLLQQVPMLPPAWAGSAAAAHHYQQHQYYHYQQQHLYLQQQQLATGEPAAALPRVEERPAPAGRCAADGAGDTIQELMHVGKEVDMTRPRKAPMMESPLPVCKEKAMSFL